MGKEKTEQAEVKAAKKKEIVVPKYKTGINLAIKEESTIPINKLIPWLIVIAIGTLVFCKFAVLDRLVALNQAEGEAAAVMYQRDAAALAAAKYDEVEAEYRVYANDWMNDAEKAVILRSDMIALINEELLPAGNLISVNTNADSLAIEMSGMSLKTASALVTKLGAREDVVSVTMGSATTQDDADTDLIITFNITMTKTEEEG